MATITSANSVYMLSIPLLYPVPQGLLGYGTDSAFAFDDMDFIEVVMGVDGRMSAGYVPNPFVQTVTLQADSPSLKLFEDWITAMRNIREVMFADATIILPSIARKYTLTKGALTRGKIAPDAAKTMQQIPFQVTWESVSVAAIA